MEKIYMEENKNRNRSFGVVNFSVVLSFVVAFFAIISLATFGIVSNQGMDAVSYAAPTGTTTGGSFQFTFGKDENNQDVDMVGSGSGGNFAVPIYLADGNINTPVFCVEHNVDPPGDGVTVTKSDPIDDYGLLWILNNSYVNGNPRVPASDTSVANDMRPYLEAWITQVTIWMYLNEQQGSITASGVKGIYDDSGAATHPTNNVKINYMRPEDIASIKSTTSIMLRKNGENGGTVYPATSGETKNLYETYVAPFVEQAKDESGKRLLAVVVEDDKISKTTDEKYYQSGKVSVQGYPPKKLLTYDVTLSGIDGATIVDGDGKEISKQGLNPNQSFFVRVPVDKVKTETLRLNIEAIGHFDTLAGNYFVSSENGSALQKVITVTGTTKDVKAGNNVDFVGVPDSGMNTAQTIYFIGLIVLLCGVGIVYANAKPVEQKQQ